MTAVERVAAIVIALDSWQTVAELGRALGCSIRAARWSLFTIARTSPVFCRRRTTRIREYRLLPEARDVRRR